LIVRLLKRCLVALVYKPFPSVFVWTWHLSFPNNWFRPIQIAVLLHLQSFYTNYPNIERFVLWFSHKANCYTLNEPAALRFLSLYRNAFAEVYISFYLLFYRQNKPLGT